MAKKNGAEDNELEAVQAEPAPPQKVKSASTTEVELKVGQALVSRVDNEDEDNYFITTISDWNNKFNAGKNAGKYKLITEKKKLIIQGSVTGIGANKPTTGCSSCGK